MRPVETGIIVGVVVGVYALVAWSLGDALFPWRDRPVPREGLAVPWNATDAEFERHQARQRALGGNAR